MKTYNQWNEQKTDFAKFVNAGDEIDEKMFYYFLEILPPVIMTSKGFLMGEPYTHDANGNPVYESFGQSGKKYFYVGLQTLKMFLHAKPVNCELCNAKSHFRLYLDRETKLRPGTNKWVCKDCYQKKSDAVKANWNALGIAT